MKMKKCLSAIALALVAAAMAGCNKNDNGDRIPGTWPLVLLHVIDNSGDQHSVSTVFLPDNLYTGQWIVLTPLMKNDWYPTKLNAANPVIENTTRSYAPFNQRFTVGQTEGEWWQNVEVQVIDKASGAIVNKAVYRIEGDASSEEKTEFKVIEEFKDNRFRHESKVWPDKEQKWGRPDVRCVELRIYAGDQ